MNVTEAMAELDRLNAGGLATIIKCRFVKFDHNPGWQSAEWSILIKRDSENVKSVEAPTLALAVELMRNHFMPAPDTVTAAAKALEGQT